MAVTTRRMERRTGAAGAAQPCRTEAASSVAQERARRGLGLTPREFGLAVELGEVRTVPPVRAGGRRRVPVTELARLHDGTDGGDALRARLRTVTATEAAALLGVGRARFTKLARAGCVSPVRFSVNRYRRVVWLYLAAELEELARRQPGLLHGALPRPVRDLLADDADCRARLWRGRRVIQLLRHVDGPWSAAAVHAAVLPPEAFEAAVPDPHERLVLTALRPEVAPGRSESPTVRAAAGDVLTARGAEEVRWHRLSLLLALAEARLHAHPPGACGADGLRSTAVRRRSVLPGPEQALLDDGDEQPSLAVVDPAAGEPPATGRDG
ncbi:DUF6397 family protein [Streptomyces sp. TRM 70351]|uniref:DUF6397 family protein n=1 Tax=Streptomyces sp. TRM 70351 TaxID=3116552 RepID=UPI002E7BF804|nr:DUF6397 family protein [Streptomyces sp. TRM 70351]MEE1927219.1 DUF6397 family protein [Streptomyces sp. TRM 70351]